MTKKQKELIKQAIAESEFTIDGRTYIAMNVPKGMDAEKACAGFCAFSEHCKKLQGRPEGVPTCNKAFRFDESEVFFIKKGARFKPEYGKKYWIATTLGKPLEVVWTDGRFDRENLLVYNTFPDEDAAQDVCDKITAILKLEAAGLSYKPAEGTLPLSRALEILEHHQAWRRYDGDDVLPLPWQYSAKELGLAIDVAIAALKKQEASNG